LKISCISHCLFSLFLLDLASVEIDEKDIQLLNAIGKGQFGKVYRGLWKGSQVAVKEIEKGYGEPDLSEFDICRQAKKNRTLLHA